MVNFWYKVRGGRKVSDMLLRLVPLVVFVDGLKVMVHLGLGGLSHIKPILEVGGVLRERNHSVIFAAPVDNERFNKHYKFPFIPLGESTLDAKAMQAKIKGIFGKREPVPASTMLKGPLGDIIALSYDSIYPSLSRVVDSDQPDVLICDWFSPACRDVALMKGIPLVSGLQGTDGHSIMDTPFVTNNMDYGEITTENMSFAQRFQDKLVGSIQKTRAFLPLKQKLNQMREKYQAPPSSTPFGDFSSTLGLANTFFGLEPAAPLPPHIKLIGPIKSDSYDPLTPGLKGFLETHQRTLYIGFGSQVILADFNIHNLVLGALDAIAQGHIDGVLWGLGRTRIEDSPEAFLFNNTRFTRDHLFGNRHPHMKLLDWAPQTAILEHSNTRLFISHGGLESSFESILSGTPILCMPFLGDQPRNARKIKDAGIGDYIDRAMATPESIADQIQTVSEDVGGGIRVNSQRMRTIALMGSRRKEAGADAIEEYVYTARICRPTQKPSFYDVPCEAKHLVMVSRDMSFIEANLLDVYAVAILLTLIPISLMVFVSYRFVAFLLSPQSTKLPAKKLQ